MADVEDDEDAIPQAGALGDDEDLSDEAQDFQFLMNLS